MKCIDEAGIMIALQGHLPVPSKMEWVCSLYDKEVMEGPPLDYE